MLYMVIEQFVGGDPTPVGERFRQKGRQMGLGLEYVGSWIDPATMRCYQVMDAETRESLDAWIANWNDIVDFEVIPVESSSDFWAKRA